MTSAPAQEPPRKKRKLPRLDDSFDEPKRPSDSPELHQGRKRAAPHVRGQWASYVYLELTPSTSLRRVLRSTFAAAVEKTPKDAAIHSLLPTNTPRSLIEGSSEDVIDVPEQEDNVLHLSLSRPLMLLTNQRDDLRKVVARTADQSAPFSARYASFGVLENDEKTRRFLGVEIGQGYAELLSLVCDLDKSLAGMRLPAYYPEPRFHTSLAWTTATSATAEDEAGLPFSETDVASLETRFGPMLRKEGQVWVGELCVKIGKNVFRYRLAG
ncbi:hypothetical protein JCM10908_004505 [Rhodotorula pacifica]|uniref:HVSL domain-containing protein n=1 Tax=Rhodotorula pacifica TaxID=1495444 RepID=UPI003171E01D